MSLCASEYFFVTWRVPIAKQRKKRLGVACVVCRPSCFDRRSGSIRSGLLLWFKTVAVSRPAVLEIPSRYAKTLPGFSAVARSHYGYDGLVMVRWWWVPYSTVPGTALQYNMTTIDLLTVSIEIFKYSIRVKIHNFVILVSVFYSMTKKYYNNNKVYSIIL